MRTILAAVIALAGLGAVANPVHAQVQKFAYLNSQMIVQSAPGAQEVQAAIQQEQQRLASRLQAFDDSNAVMIADYNKQSVLLSPDEKKRREDQILQRQQSWGQRAEILQQEAASRQQELLDPVMKRVEDVIEAVRKEGNYAIIFDAASQAMVAADTTLDLTSTIIERLQAQASGDGAAGRR